MSQNSQSYVEAFELWQARRMLGYVEDPPNYKDFSNEFKPPKSNKFYEIVVHFPDNLEMKKEDLNPKIPINDLEEFDQIKKKLASKIMKALVLPPSALTDKLGSLEQAKIQQQLENKYTNMTRHLTIDIDTEKLEAATNDARSCLADLINRNSDVFKKLEVIAKDAAKRKRWATDPLDLMPYFNRFKLSKLRQSLSFFLYDLARWVDPDFLD